MAEQKDMLRHPGALLPPVFDENCDLSGLPRECVQWPVTERHSGGGTPQGLRDIQTSLKSAAAFGRWQWPEKPVVFLSDLHADAEGFLRSLVAAGAIQRTGPGLDDFVLTPFGTAARFIIGGDCLDKGPSNLDTLDALRAFIDTGVDVHLLAGNHDLRLLLAVSALAGPRSTLTDHMFVRMGRKAVPLMREVWDRYLGEAALHDIPDEQTCRKRIFPRRDWFDEFPQQAAPHLPPALIKKELRSLKKKRKRFDDDVARAGMTMRMLFAAAQHCKTLFLDDQAPYAWFYDTMDVIYRSGSILFVHAGLCDAMCSLLAEGGPGAVNARFRHEARRDPFAFYSGAVANLVRTKYRETDKHLSEAGVRQLHLIGIKMVVHGHVNNHAGQRLLTKNGLLHLEGDVTLDRASRDLEGLPGIGAGATLIYPSGDVVGLSSDFPKAKHFQPERESWNLD